MAPLELDLVGLGDLLFAAAPGSVSTTTLCSTGKAAATPFCQLAAGGCAAILPADVAADVAAGAAGVPMGRRVGSTEAIASGKRNLNR